MKRSTSARPPGRGRAGRLALALALLAASGALAQPGGPLPGPLPLFPPDNWWNLDVSAAPVDPASGSILRFIGLGSELHPDFGGDADVPPEVYGMIYVSVPGSQPLVPVTFVEFGDESDAGAPGRPPGYPIPGEAKTQPRWLEGGYPGGVDADGDRHLLIVDRDHRILYELYHVFWNQGLGRWEAGSGAVFPLTENRRRPEGWTSADAAGLAILPGLVRYDEVFGPEPIRHAFRFTARATDGHVWPASHSAGDTAGAPPLGTRLRLKAGKDLSGYPPEVRKIFQAMKTYGLILADNGSDLYVTGAYDQRWDNDVLNPAFGSLTASDFEVIELGWRPGGGSGGGGGSCVPAPDRLCLQDGRFAVEVAWRTATGARGTGRAVPLTGETGYFWFFDPANVELVLKVIDGCALGGRYWVFAGGLTDVRAEIAVTDTRSGATRRYVNPLGVPFQPIQDTGAFAACP